MCAACTRSVPALHLVPGALNPSTFCGRHAQLDSLPVVSHSELLFSQASAFNCRTELAQALSKYAALLVAMATLDL